MKRIVTIVFIFTIMLTGCNKTIKPVKVVETDFDIQEAESIMKRAWKPVHQMTNANYETRPNIPISSKEEFFEKYDFRFMDQYMAEDIYESIVDFDNDHKEVRDDDGNLVFGEGKLIPYVPTIYDERVVIRKAYLRDSRYEEEYASLNVVELVVEEIDTEPTSHYTSNFSRLNFFRKNEKGDWVLHHISETMVISWER